MEHRKKPTAILLTQRAEAHPEEMLAYLPNGRSLSVARRSLTLGLMQLLEPPDSHHLRAAIGWLELGMAGEARAEIGNISPTQQNHPDVLEVHWMICAAEKQWDAAVDIARALVQSAPQRSSGWVHRAYSLRRASGGGLQAAWEALLPACKKFPKESIIPYNLSCYACQQNQLAEALVWFKRALKIGKKEEMKQAALEDSDLRPLWEEIRKL